MCNTDTHKGRFMLSQRGRRVHSRQPRPRTAHPRRARHAPRKRSRRSPPWARSGTCTARTLCTPATRHPAARASGLEGRFGVRSGAPRGARRVKPTVFPINPRANPTAPRGKLQALKDPTPSVGCITRAGRTSSRQRFRQSSLVASGLPLLPVGAWHPARQSCRPARLSGTGRAAATLDLPSGGVTGRCRRTTRCQPAACGGTSGLSWCRSCLPPGRGARQRRGRGMGW
jgi:hypothetical protein